MNLNTILLSEFEDEMNTTKKFIESISENLFDYQPHEKSQTLGGLVNHFIPIVSWIPLITQKEELDWSQVTPPTSLKSKADMLKQFEVNVDIGIEALEATNNEQLLESWTMRYADTIMFTGQKETGIRRYVFNHMVHHRAQLGLYLRLNDVKVPGSYVKSADDSLY